MSHIATTTKERSFRTLLLAVSLDPREIGRRIKRARERKGWTQLEFALEAHVSPGTVQRWEAGKLPRVRELMRVADLLEVATEELVEAEESSESLDQIRRQLAAEADRFAELNERLAALLAGAESRLQSRRTRAGS